MGKWTARDVPYLSGRTLVITGGNSGIGLEAARTCARRGARVILACRNLAKAEAAAQRLRSTVPGASVETVELDLMRLASVRECAASLLERAPRIDGLVNNAGIMATPYQQTEDGFESQLATNHFGHFALTGLLLPALLAAPSARVVHVSSLAHAAGRIDWDNLHNPGGRGYDRRRAYARSKLANLLFMRGLQARFKLHHVRARSLAAHPGLAQTNLMGPLEADLRWLRPLRPIVHVFMQSAEMGALPTLRALTDPGARGGEYYGPGGYRQFWGYPRAVNSTRVSRDPDTIERFWEVSEELTGVRFDWHAALSESGQAAASDH